MCSIFGILDIKSDAVALRKTALEMSKRLRHRGLDGLREGAARRGLPVAGVDAGKHRLALDAPALAGQVGAALLLRQQGDLHGAMLPLHGKDLLPAAGEYTVEVIAAGLIGFVERHLPQHDLSAARAWLAANAQRRADVAKAVGTLPARPPGFCIGCPERPVFPISINRGPA